MLESIMGHSIIISFVQLQHKNSILVAFCSLAVSKSLGIILRIHLLTLGYLINDEVRVSRSSPKFELAEKNGRQSQ